MMKTQNIDHSIVKEQVLGSLLDRYNRMYKSVSVSSRTYAFRFGTEDLKR